MCVGNVKFYTCDVTDPKAIAEVAKRVRADVRYISLSLIYEHWLMLTCMTVGTPYGHRQQCWYRARKHHSRDDPRSVYAHLEGQCLGLPQHSPRVFASQ